MICVQFRKYKDPLFKKVYKKNQEYCKVNEKRKNDDNFKDDSSNCIITTNKLIVLQKNWKVMKQIFWPKFLWKKIVKWWPSFISFYIIINLLFIFKKKKTIFNTLHRTFVIKFHLHFDDWSTSMESHAKNLNWSRFHQNEFTIVQIFAKNK